jgi:hypothetical protein
MLDIPLTPDQEALAQRIATIVGQKAQQEILAMARLLASRPDAQLLGAVEFDVRERSHRIAAQALQAALQERKKGATKGRV